MLFLNTYISVCNHHLDPGREPFKAPQQALLFFFQMFSKYTPSRGNYTILISTTISFTGSWTSYRWNHTACSLSFLASFNEHICKIHPCCWECQFILFVSMDYFIALIDHVLLIHVPVCEHLDCSQFLKNSVLVQILPWSVLMQGPWSTEMLYAHGNLHPISSRFVFYPKGSG